MSLMSLALKCWRGKGQVPDHTFSDVGVNAFPVSQARTGAGVQNSDPRATRSPTQWALRPQPPIAAERGVLTDGPRSGLPSHCSHHQPRISTEGSE